MQQSMKLAVGLDGLDTPDRIQQLARDGADEFFAGFVPHEWSQRYGWEIGLNRRNFGPHCQYAHYDTLRQAIETVHAQGKRIAIAFNAHAYCDEQTPLLRRIVSAVDELGPDGYVVADPALMILLARWGVRRPLHLSTGAACFNSATVRYFHGLEGVDVRRVIIPRKMALREMGVMIDRLKDLDLEFEAMIIGYRCHFNDELCFSWHCGEGSNLCNLFVEAPASTTPRLPSDWKDALEAARTDPAAQFQEGSVLDRLCRKTALGAPPAQPETRQGAGGAGMDSALAAAVFGNCGLCAITALRKLGVSVLKIPTRGIQCHKSRLLRAVRTVADHPNPTPELCRSLINSEDFCSETGHCYYDLRGVEV